MHFRLKQEMQVLVRHCFLWCRDSRIVPCHLDECWGPSEDDLKDVAKFEYTKQVDYSAYDTEPEDLSSPEEDEAGFADEELYT